LKIDEVYFLTYILILEFFKWLNKYKLRLSILRLLVKILDFFEGFLIKKIADSKKIIIGGRHE